MQQRHDIDVNFDNKKYTDFNSNEGFIYVHKYNPESVYNKSLFKVYYTDNI